MNKRKSDKQSKGKWFDSKYEYDIVNGERVLAHVTEEKETSKWYNSGIFLWFLGALFVTFIPWLWGIYSSSREKEDRVEKLDNEMVNRLDQLIAFVWRGTDSIKKINHPILNTESAKDDSLNVNNILYGFIGAPSHS